MGSTSPEIVASAIGRRKTAVASVRLLAGGGQITVNGQPVSRYFPTPAAASRYLLPLKVLEVEAKYDVQVKVRGGGPTGQLDAFVLGLARCLAQHKPEYKARLRQHGLVTRDARERQRRMVGMGGKSRRKKQSPKR